MKLTIRFLLLLSLVVILVSSAFTLIACKDKYEPASENGTYYFGADGEINRDNYYKLKDKTWTDNGGSSGDYKLSGTSITLYIDMFGTTTEYMSGTLSDGVLALEVTRGTVEYYYKNGKIPDNLPNVDPKPDPQPEVKTKTVSFNLNGGDGEIEPMQFEVGKTMSNLPTPNRDGYTFVCWTDEFGTEYTAATVMPNTDLSLTAKWEKKITSYKDEYISLSPASEGYKRELIRDLYQDDVDQFVYVELTSDDLGGIDQVGVTNNFTLRTLDGMDYKIDKGYTWQWYQGNFSTPNGAQRFTLGYGSNIQFITVQDGSGLVLRTYLLDIYVKHDYYISLYSNIFEKEPYDRIRVIENERFSANTEAKEEKGFEFDKRVYYNKQTSSYEEFVYTTAITSDWSLYQTYKPVTIAADLDGGSLADELVITPYTQYFTLPSAEKDGYDFLGWQNEHNEYLTNVQGYSGINYISQKDTPQKLTAIYAKKTYYYTFEDDTLKTYKTVPVVTYTDNTMRTILEINYTPYNTDCVLPVKTVQSGGKLFIGWQHYFLYNNNEFSRSLSSFNFNTKITKPVALAPNTETPTDHAVPLNGELTSRDTGSYRMYLPADERYQLTISSINSVTLTINKYGATSNARTLTVRSGSPQTVNLDYYIYNLGSTEYSHGYVTFNVTSLSGSFTVKLSGATANSAGSPIAINKDNTAAVGEDFTVPLVKNGYAFAGWYENGSKISDNEFITMQDKEIEATAKWVTCPVTLEKNIAEAGTVSGVSGTTVIGEDVTIKAVTKSGYTWLGWYNGDTLLTKELEYTFAMPSENVTYTAKWIKVSFDRSSASAGTVSSLSKTYLVGDEVTVKATTNSGYTWVGWYNGETLLTNDSSYTFAMPSKNVTYTAKWIKVSVDRSSTSAGTVSNLSKTYLVGDEATITATTSNGYTWVGWYDGETLLTNDLSYTFEMPTENTTFTAKWSKVTLTRNNSSAGTISSLSSKYTAGQEVTITAATNNGYTWVGWYNGDTLLTNELNYTFEMPSEDATYTARWTKLTLIRNNTYAGTVSSLNDKYEAGDEVTVTATTNNGYTWVGWYNGETLLTNDSSYTFAMPSKNVTYTAKWIKVYLDKSIVNAGTVSSLSEIYLVGDEVTVTASTYAGYTWIGWYNGETLLTSDLSYTFEMPSENVTYTAHWTSYTITTSQNLSGAGSITAKKAEKATAGQEVVINATTYKGYTFEGWYDGETKLTNELTYTFDMPFENVTYTAKWKVNDELSNFKFTSTSYSLTINGINDKLVTSIVVPDYVTSIAEGVFSGCSNLENITLPFVGGEIRTSSSTYQYPFGYIFGTSSYTGGVATLQNYYQSSTLDTSYSTYYIPSTLKFVIISGGNILRGAFYNCGNLMSITLPNNLTSIGDYAFYDCRELTSLTVDNVSYIGSHAFSGCYNLANITIPSVVTIKDYAFSYCRSLTSVTLPDSVQFLNEGVFSGCVNLKSITTPAVSGTFGYIFGTNSYTGGVAVSQTQSYNNSKTYYIPSALEAILVTRGSISDYEFENFSTVTSITIPNNVTSIGEGVFKNCSNLTSIIIPDSVTSIGKFAFDNCNSLTSITIPDSVTSIGKCAFDNCNSVTSIIIPNNVTTIDEKAFQNCSSIASVTIGNSVTKIGDSAFEGCSKLGRVNWNATACTHVGTYYSVTKVDYTIFKGCSKLTTVVIDDNVTIIPNDAFYGRGLTNVTIGNGVTKIADSAFSGCSKLKSVCYKGTANDWEKISIGSSNTYLTNATRYYYSENEPALNDDGTDYNGNYWHYVDGVVTVWKKES